MLEQMNSFHPTEPHWYLPMIGVAIEADRRKAVRIHEVVAGLASSSAPICW